MIDATRSPRPAWKRVATAVALIVAIVLAVWIIWIKELHHQSIHLRVLAPAITAPARLAVSGSVDELFA